MINPMQKELFGGEAFARDFDPETSHLAALGVSTAALELRVYEAGKKFPTGFISDDIARALPDLGIQTFTPRFAPLLRKGLLVDTGFKRRGVSGRSQRVMRSV